MFVPSERNAEMTINSAPSQYGCVLSSSKMDVLLTPVLGPGLASCKLERWYELDWRKRMIERQKERVQLDFAPEALQRLDDIKQKTGATTRAEVVRNALRVYEWLVNEVDPDSTIKVVNKSNEATDILKVKLLIK
jgi:hypothetical protein